MKEAETIKKVIERAAECQIPYQEQKYTEQQPKIDLEDEGRIFRETFEVLEPSFIIEKSDKRILNSIFAWVWRRTPINSLGLDYNKGLFLYGSLGRGKTLTLLALREYLRGLQRRHFFYHRSDYRLGTYWMTASRLANRFAADGQTALEEFYEPRCCLFIDELGREPNPANNFGTKMDVIQFLLQMRYDHRRTSVTHISTNLGLEQIGEIYGNYIADRCLEMFNFIEFKGESLRR